LNFAQPELTSDPFKKATWSFGTHTFTAWQRLLFFRSAPTYKERKIKIYCSRSRLTK
jgi:hypothetical protein